MVFKKHSWNSPLFWCLQEIESTIYPPEDKPYPKRKGSFPFENHFLRFHWSKHISNLAVEVGRLWSSAPGIVGIPRNRYGIQRCVGR